MEPHLVKTPPRYWKTAKHLFYLYLIFVLLFDLYFLIEWSGQKYHQWESRVIIPGEVLDLYKEKHHSYQIKKNGEFDFSYRLMAPKNIEEGKQYPLILYLHGSGSRGNDNKKQLRHIPVYLSNKDKRNKFSCYLLAPQCPTDLRWGNSHWLTDQEDQSLTANRFLIELIAKMIKQHQVDPKRIYLAGISMGGFGAWSLAGEYPDLFAAVVPICGGGNSSDAEKLVKIPIWAIHGDADTAVSVEGSRNMIKAIKKAGGKPEYTEIKWAGHDVWKNAFLNTDEVLDWMFKQRKSMIIK